MNRVTTLDGDKSLDKMPLLPQPDDPQDAAHRALSGCQQGTQQQQSRVAPGALLHKHWNKC
jgi:hypothetical protein